MASLYSNRRTAITLFFWRKAGIHELRSTVLFPADHSRIRLHILERVPGAEHASVQNARNEDADPRVPVKNHMPPLFKAMQAGTNPVAGPAQSWIGSERFRALLQVVEVTLCLCCTPTLKRERTDATQVCPCA